MPLMIRRAMSSLKWKIPKCKMSSYKKVAMLRYENSRATTNKVEERALLEAKLSGLQNLDMDASLSQSLAEVKQGDYSRLSDPDLVSCLQRLKSAFRKKWRRKGSANQRLWLRGEQR